MFDSRIQNCEGGFLRYACVESARGRLLVLMSDQGVVDVILGDSKTEMLSCAARRFPSAGFVPDKGAHSVWVAAVVARVELPEVGMVIPVDLGFGYRLRPTG
jgi:hypothetical protein